MPVILPQESLVFDRFRVDKQVSWSGQSCGYRAFDLLAPDDEPWRQEVFLKQYIDLPIGSSQAKALTGHFESLRRRLGDQDNYICLPLYLGEASNSLIAAYPWVEGKTLKDVMSDGMTQEESVRIAAVLTNTVRKLHKQNIAHLDLKPTNVVVQENWKDGKLYIRLIDLDAAQIDGQRLRQHVLGTHLYKSPEHCFPTRFGEVSTKCDVFTLGIMLFELLFKEHPFNDVLDYSQAIAEEAFVIPPISYPPDVIEVLSQCLSADPYDRPEAGRVLKILNDRYHSLATTNLNVQWNPIPAHRLYLELEQLGSPITFRRTYYETVNLDRNQLRGASISPHQLSVRFVLDTGSWWLKVVNESIEVTLQGQPLHRGNSIRLISNQVLGLGAASFSVRIVEY